MYNSDSSTKMDTPAPHLRRGRSRFGPSKTSSTINERQTVDSQNDANPSSIKKAKTFLAKNHSNSPIPASEKPVLQTKHFENVYDDTEFEQPELPNRPYSFAFDDELYNRNENIATEKKPIYTDLQNMKYHTSPEYDESFQNLNFDNNVQSSSNSSHINTKGHFSITHELDTTVETETTQAEKLTSAIDDGNLLEIGRCLRIGIQTNTLSEVQLEEIARTVNRPKIPLLSSLQANEMSDLEDLKSFNAANIFLSSMPPAHEKQFKRLQCSVNSLTHTLKENNTINSLEHRELDISHRLTSINNFVAFDFNRFYLNYVFVGDGPVFQLTNMLVQVLRKMTEPSYEIWKYAFHPRSSKTVDFNFLLFPAEVIEKLQGFSFDVCEAFLPDELLTGPIDPSHPFLEKLPLENPNGEIQRRRSIRQTVLQTINNAIWQSMRTLRSYHFDKITGKLLSCSNRGDCSKHLKWEHLKGLRDQRRKMDQNPEEYTVADLIEYARATQGTPKVDRRGRQPAVLKGSQ